MAAMMKTAASMRRAAVEKVRCSDFKVVNGVLRKVMLTLVSVACSSCSWLLGDAVAASGGVGEAALSDEAELFAVVTGAPRRMPPPVDAISFTCPLLSSSAVAAADGSFISDASSVPFPATLPLSEDAVAASGGIGEAASPPVTLASSDDNFSTISLRCCSRNNVRLQRPVNVYSCP
ncbi:DMT family transporter [Babesia caballi]|uniref:DMT family transporter n=1 Tax=Babesia caballi TaxID=5871 RepID=A0AAV4LP73_BABCB|nr:DMT family transporter [Babesia caballi]